MRKKLMLVAALAGILSLGACVDDKESASVEAIRNAKAEQLKSVAALNNAEAEATKALAAAEVALKAAETEARQLANDLEKVEIEKAKVQLELEKLRLELEKVQNDAAIQTALAKLENDLAQLEIEKAQLEYKKQAVIKKLEIAAIELEQQLLNAKANLLQAETAYKNAIVNADSYEKTRLETLLTEHINATNALVDAKKLLADYNRELLELENDLISFEEQNAKDIAELETEIAGWEARKAAYEQFGALDKNEAKKAYDVADSERLVLENNYTVSFKAYNNAVTESNNVENKLFDSTYYYKLLTVFMGRSYGGMYINYDYSTKNYFYDKTDAFGITTSIPLFTGWLQEDHEIDIVYDDKTYGGTAIWYEITDFYTLKTAGFDSYIADFKKYITDNQKKIADNAKKEYDLAVKAEEVAKEKAELESATQADKDAYLTAYYEANSKKTALETANKNLAYQQEELALVEDTYAFLKEQATGIKELVNSYNTISENAGKLNVQYRKDYRAYTLKAAEVNALWDIYIEAANVEELISDCENRVSDLRDKIDAISDITSIEEAIEAKKVEISNQEATVAKEEIAAAVAKAAFEAAAQSVTQ